MNEQNTHYGGSWCPYCGTGFWKKYKGQRYCGSCNPLPPASKKETMNEHEYMLVRGETIDDDCIVDEVIATGLNKDGLTQVQEGFVRDMLDTVSNDGSCTWANEYVALARAAFSETFKLESGPKADSPLIVFDAEEYLSQYSAEELSAAYRKVITGRKDEVTGGTWKLSHWGVPEVADWFQSRPHGAPMQCEFNNGYLELEDGTSFQPGLGTRDHHRWILTRIVEEEDSP